MFSCEFSEIFKNNFFTEHVWATASFCYNTFLQVFLKIFRCLEYMPSIILLDLAIEKLYPIITRV